jgi:hypothetical protein
VHTGGTLGQVDQGAFEEQLLESLIDIGCSKVLDSTRKPWCFRYAVSTCFEHASGTPGKPEHQVAPRPSASVGDVFIYCSYAH